jgi:hypothetical protein
VQARQEAVIPLPVKLPDRLTRAIAASALAALLAIAMSGAGIATAGTGDHPGPALTTEPDLLDAALSCPGGVRGEKAPVLLVPGAGGDPVTVFAAGLEPVLRGKDYPYCTLTLPGAGLTDLQVQAEYVVASVRAIQARSGRPVSLIGVSSGGMLLRWAVKWWPDVRSLVGDVIGIAPSNHGFDFAAPLCAGPCPPATRQQKPDSKFFEMLNSEDETPGRLPYSVISSADDGTVSPPLPDLDGDRDDSNTQIQAVCPGREVNHAHLGFDAVALGLALDGLRHDGPARSRRIPSSICSRTYPPGVDASEVEEQIAAGAAHVAANWSRAGLTEIEPPLRSYAERGAPEPTATLRIRPRRVDAGERTKLSFIASASHRRQSWPLPGATIRIAGRQITTDSNGTASLRLRARRKGSLPVKLLAPGLPPVGDRLLVDRF